jgi:hypothetical protein
LIQFLLPHVLPEIRYLLKAIKLALIPLPQGLS